MKTGFGCQTFSKCTINLIFLWSGFLPNLIYWTELLIAYWWDGSFCILKEISLLSAMETLLQDAWNETSLDENNLSVVIRHYGDDLNPNRLHIENLKSGLSMDWVYVVVHGIAKYVCVFLKPCYLQSNMTQRDLNL